MKKFSVLMVLGLFVIMLSGCASIRQYYPATESRVGNNARIQIGYLRCYSDTFFLKFSVENTGNKAIRLENVYLTDKVLDSVDKSLSLLTKEEGINNIKTKERVSAEVALRTFYASNPLQMESDQANLKFLAEMEKEIYLYCPEGYPVTINPGARKEFAVSFIYPIRADPERPFRVVIFINDSVETFGFDFTF